MELRIGAPRRRCLRTRPRCCSILELHMYQNVWGCICSPSRQLDHLTLASDSHSRRPPQRRDQHQPLESRSWKFASGARSASGPRPHDVHGHECANSRSADFNVRHPCEARVRIRTTSRKRSPDLHKVPPNFFDTGFPHALDVPLAPSTVSLPPLLRVSELRCLALKQLQPLAQPADLLRDTLSDPSEPPALR